RLLAWRDAMTSANQMLDDRFEEAGWRLVASHRSDIGMRPTVPNIAKVPIWNFESNGERISCDRPVQVEIRAEQDGCFASCERLHVHSHGHSVEECLADLNRQVIDFYDSYT